VTELAVITIARTFRCADLAAYARGAIPRRAGSPPQPPPQRRGALQVGADRGPAIGRLQPI